MKRKQIEAFWVTAPHHCQYLTGLYGHNELDLSVVITASFFAIVANRLYTEAIQKAGWEVIPITVSIIESLRELLKRNHIKKLCIESRYVSWARVDMLRRHLRSVDISPDSGLVQALRVVKDEDEMMIIREGCRRTDAALEKTVRKIRKGMTEKEIAWELEKNIRDGGADDLSFRPIIVAAGPNSAEPHHVPGEYRMQARDIIQIDCGGRYQGYGTDLSRVIFVGQPRSEWIRVLQLVRAVQRQAIAGVRTGITGARIDRQSRKMIEKAGYQAYVHGLGHGIGLDPTVHEDPILADRKAYTNVKLGEGMVFTIEPAVYLEGAFGIRLEDVVAIRAGKTRVFSHAPYLLALH